LASYQIPRYIAVPPYSSHSMASTASSAPTAGPSTPLPAKTQVHGTRPEQLAASHKRQKGPSLYHNLLPLIPAKPSYLATLLSSFPFLSLSPPQIQAIYDEMTRTVWVQQDDDMVLLWRRGFFGKGTLSRSEPSWKRRVENKIAELEGREKSEFIGCIAPKRIADPL
jgi:tRNA-splicing endonuclease subunit Sen2